MNQRPPRPPPPKQKGTVTSIASVFPAEEAQKASQLVKDTLAERQKQVDQLREFIADNASLVNLVQGLPDELHHNIMVPFGKAAFFPGKLIHTNELLVLLGEGYYVERTAKQAVDLLKRRGKNLETQVEAAKAVMQDLKAEASFFETTAAEAAEGLVEIREDYTEEASSVDGFAVGGPRPDTSPFPEAGNRRAAVEDEEYDLIFSRLDELEKEEEEADKSNKDDEDEEDKDDLHHHMSQHITTEEFRSSEVHHLSDRVGTQVSLDDHLDDDNHDPLHVVGQERVLSKDGSLHDKGLTVREHNIPEKGLKLHEEKKNDHASQITKKEVSEEKSEPSASSNKAFTGTIVERSFDPKMNAINQKVVGRSTKPVSRFKLQRK